MIEAPSHVMKTPLFKLMDLLYHIYVNAINEEVYRLCKKHCYGCTIHHTNAWYHDCYAMPLKDRWLSFGRVAVKNVKNQQLEWIWQDFIAVVNLLHLEYDSEIVLVFAKMVLLVALLQPRRRKL